MSAPLDLYEVMRRYAAGRAHADVPALVAEVERLSAEVERRERIIDAERNMQANLVAEGTRLSAENARLRFMLEPQQ